MTRLTKCMHCAGLSLAATGKCSSVRCVEISEVGERAFWRSAARLPKPHVPLEYHVASAGSNPAAWLKGVEVAILDPPRKGLGPELLAFLCEQLPAPGHNPAPAADHVERRHSTLKDVVCYPSASEDDKPLAVQDLAAPTHSQSSVPLAATKSKRALRHRKKHASRKPLAVKAVEYSTSQPLDFDNLEILQQLFYLSCGWASFTRDSQALTASGRWHLVSAKAFVFFPGTNSLETLAVFQRIGMPVQTPRVICRD